MTIQNATRRLRVTAIQQSARRSTCIGSCHPFSSSSEINILMPTATSIPIPHSYYDIIERCKELPEINQALKLDPKLAIPLLKRGADIFLSMAKNLYGLDSGSEDYRAVILLLARAQGLSGNHAESAQTLKDLQAKMKESDSVNSDEYTDVSFALCKTLFNNGDFEETLHLSNDLADNLLCDKPITTTAWILRSGSFRNAACSSRLMQAMKHDGYIDEELKDSILNGFQDSVSALNASIFDATSELYFTPRDRIALGIADAASLGNLGIAEVCFRRSSKDEKYPGNTPWKSALSILDSLPIDQEQATTNGAPVDCYYSDLLDLIRARVHLNMSYSIMFGCDSANKKLDKTTLNRRIEKSMGASRKALKIYEKLVPKYPRLSTSLARVLGLLGSCYKLTGSAVTAEGLFQAALDKFDEPSLNGSNPLSLIDKHGILSRAAKLYEDWEKREADAKILITKAKDVVATLPQNWQEAPEITSGIWLWSSNNLVTTEKSLIIN